MDINGILTNAALSIDEKITELQKKSIKVPSWQNLIKEYDQRKHPVKTDPEYIPKGKERVSHITLGWQKSAVNHTAALLCGIPVKRVYHPENEAQKTAAKAIEEIYKKNRIDAVNLERAKWLYACCEVVTIWYAQEVDTNYGGHNSRLKLRCKNYAPIKGDALYPLFDEYDDLVALSVKYQRTEQKRTVSYFDTYTADRHVCWNLTTQEEVLNEQINIGKINGIYVHRDEPVWEGESENVYEAEWTYSRNGNYIRKNSRPKLVVYSDHHVKADKGPKGEAVQSEAVRLGKDDKMEYVTWNGSTEAIKFHVEELKHNFFAQLQLPDVSMDNMKSSPMSGEARKMLFLDAQMKVTLEQGLWLEAFDREFNVVRAFAKMMFPGLATAIDELVVEHLITPYNIADEKENVETLTTACGTIASKRTCVSRLGWADDVDEEVRMLNEEGMEDVFNPTV